MIRGLPRDPLLAAIMQAVEQQKLQEQQKAQVLQAMGYGLNPMPMGAIPQNSSVLALDGQAYTRPGGAPPGQILQTLLGARVGGGMRGLQDPASFGTFHQERPGAVPDALGNNERGFVQNQLQTGIDSKDATLIEFLRRNFPELFGEQQQNSGLSLGTRFRGM